VTLITDQLRVAARRFPDEIGFTVAGVGDLTFAEWHTNSSRFARGLIAAGVEPGDRVALALTPRDGLRFVIAYAGTHKAGGVAVPVNVRMSAGEVTGLLRHSEPKVAVVSDSLRNLVDASVVPSLSTVVVAGQKPADDAGSPFEVVAWDDVPAGDDTDVQVPRESDDLAEILYTSGTTSTPKGVAIRHSNSALVVLSDPEWTGKSWLHASPMFTMAGLTFVYQSMRMGMRTLYLPRFDAGEWLRLVQAERPAATFLVPAMVELLMSHPDLG
jgi:acyl-CoA synthetase (AMP-forming)/AMP-acid ligase II